MAVHLHFHDFGTSEGAKKAAQTRAHGGHALATALKPGATPAQTQAAATAPIKTAGARPQAKPKPKPRQQAKPKPKPRQQAQPKPKQPKEKPSQPRSFLPGLGFATSVVHGATAALNYGNEVQAEFQRR